MKKIRLKFFYSILRQDAEFHDTHESGDINVRMSR